MRVLISGLSRFTSLSGICRHAVNVVKALAGASSITRIDLVVGRWQEDYYRSALQPAGTARIIPVDIPNNSISRNLWFRHALPRVAAANRVDLVHASFPIPIDRRRFRAALVTTVHDLYPFDNPGNFGFPAYIFNRLFFRVALHASDLMVCVSDTTRLRLIELFPASNSRSTTIPNAVDIQEVPPQMPPWAPERFILAVGQHRKNKNHITLLNAYAALRKSSGRLSEHRLVLVGSDGPESSRIRRYTQNLGLSSHVLMKAALADAELRWLYEHAAVLVAPSTVEGFCLPVAEAMSVGATVVCSDIPTFREVAGDQATYFSLGRDEELKLAAAIEDATATKPRANARTASRYTVSAIQKQLLEAYSLARSGASRPK